MKKHFNFILVSAGVCFAFTLFASHALGQGIGDRNRPAGSGGNYAIQGRVYLPDGKAAEGVRVNLSSADAPGASTITDTSGVFMFSSLLAGNYTVSAKTEGLPAENESVMIDRDTPAGRTFQVVVYLRNPGQKKGDIYSANPLFKDVSKPALEKYKKAVEKIQKDDLKAAQTLLDEAVALDPKFAAAYYEKGLVNLKQNDVDNALQSFVKAIEAKPDYLDAKYYFGVAQYSKKNFPVAEAVFRDVIKTKNDMPTAHMYLGITLIALKKNDEAESELRSAVSIKGGENLALAHRYLGGLYMQKKRNAEAAAELERYQELSPKATDAERIRSLIADLRKQG